MAYRRLLPLSVLVLLAGMGVSKVYLQNMAVYEFSAEAPLVSVIKNGAGYRPDGNRRNLGENVRNWSGRQRKCRLRKGLGWLGGRWFGSDRRASACRISVL